MQRAILVVTDNSEAGWLNKAVELGPEVAVWEILPLGVSQEMYAKEHQGKLRQLGMWRFVDIQSFADSAQEQIREVLPGFIFELPRQALGSDGSLFDLLKSPKANFWWFLEISEKSPLRGTLVNQLYFLALIRAAVSERRYDEVWCAVADKGLARSVEGSASTLAPVRLIKPLATRRLLAFSAKAWVRDSTVLRYFVSVCRAFVSFLLHSVVLRLAGRGRWHASSRESIVFFSFFPAWWHNPYGANAVEKFFELLPAEISRRVPVHYAVWLTLGPFELWRRRSEINEVFERLKMIPLQQILTLRDSLYILSPRHLARLLRFRFRLANQLRASFAGFNVAPLVVNEIYRSMTSSEFFLDLLMMRAFEILTEQLPTRAVIYRVEFQPFEKAILYGIRGKSLAIAFQHSTFGRNYLPYFFVPGEIALYRSNGSESTHMPLPDLVFTTGAYALDVLERNGFPRASLDVCGPVRFARLSKYIRDRQTKAALREKLGLSMSKKVFLVMTSVVREESMSLLAALSFALGELDEAPYIVFKSHPAMPMDGEFKRLVVPTLSDGDYRVLPVDAPIYDYMSLSEGVILAGSTVCLEAMVLGAIPIVFESKVVFDAKSMAEIGQAVLQVSNHRELKKAIGWVSAGDKRVNEMRRFASQAVEAMFYRLDKNPNRQFVSLLEGHGIIAEDTSREAAHA